MSGTLPFLAACRREPTPHTPIWIMRQAGRYLEEYRAVREKVDFLTLTKTPELAAEVTLQPIRRFALDASILFSDIMTPVEGMGIELDFNPGPVITNPIRSQAQVDALRIPDPEENVPFVMETIRILRRELPAHVPLIGFGGAPFTLFCYAVEGKGSKTFSTAKSFLYGEPDASHALLGKLGDMVGAYLEAQAQAGAQALMVFDSWAGLLGPGDYRRFALPALERVMARIVPLGLPIIYFPNQGSTLLESVRTLPVDVVGIDWRLPLSEARRILGPEKAVQGNLDPAALFAPPSELLRLAGEVLDEAGPAPGHIFNLGHGIERTTDPDQVARLVDFVHEESARRKNR
ncbi:MAG: uroporphyrinogen decarboxylase [Candidatus Eisenbacteria bacterium]|nr:uroporphyrinogen decarboxylase [Candidatus Eisenbacteria bacterium]